MTELDDSDYVFNIKTVQSAPFRTLIEALKEILLDCNLEIDKSGIRIQAMDPTHTVLIHLKLEAANFEKYVYNGGAKPQVIGVSMMHFFRLIKTMAPSDTLSLFMEKDDTNKLGILVENGEKNQKTKFKLNLMDIPSGQIEIPPAEFDSELTWVSSDFQKICRDMIGMGAEEVEIKSSDGQLILTGFSEYATQETVIGESGSGAGSITFVQNSNPDEVVQGLYNLKYLSMFSKCTNLCSTIRLYLKNDYPLIIRYKVATLGEIKFCIAPKS
jgi:proliferating cell nuclear antigen